MATIAENLQALNEAKIAIKNAIEKKGRDLTNVAFVDYASEILAINSDTPSLDFREITDLVGDQGSGFTTSLSQDKISITITPGSDHGDYKGRLIGFDTIKSNKISLTVSNANNSAGRLQLVLRLLDSRKGVVNVTDCSGDNATIYDQYGNKYLLVTLEAGASTTVTATVAKENAISCIELRPFILTQTYMGSFTVSEIYDGERKKR